jgi:hypothetical protein
MHWSLMQDAAHDEPSAAGKNAPIPLVLSHYHAVDGQRRVPACLLEAGNWALSDGAGSDVRPGLASSQSADLPIPRATLRCLPRDGGLQA